ncbi:MAG: VWA domain-containing protein [Vicinamibacterales bacterium]
MRVTRGLASLILGSHVWLAQMPVQQQPVFRTDTVLVPVDVRVVDKSGKPITNLRASDFTVYENDTPQKIAHFSTRAYVPSMPSEDEKRPRRENPGLEIDATPQRTFALVLGRGRLEHPAMGLEALIDFVERQLLPQDWVTLIAYQRATDFTRDRKSIVKLLERYREHHGGIETQLQHWFRGLQGVYGSPLLPPHIVERIEAVFAGNDMPRVRQLAYGGSVEGELAEHRKALLENVDPTTRRLTGWEHHKAARHELEELYAAIEYLRPLQGEKHLVFLTETAFHQFGTRMTDILADMAADARVTLSTIQTGGLPTNWTPPGYNRPPRILSRSWTQTFGVRDARSAAEQTGGGVYLYRRANDALREIDATTRFQYVIGYYPSNPVWDGSRRKVRVSVNVPGATVRYRRAYFANRTVLPADRQAFVRTLRVSTAAAYGQIISDIPLRLSATASKIEGNLTEVRVELLVDVSRVDVSSAGDQASHFLDVAVFIGDARENSLAERWGRLDLNVTGAADVRLSQENLKHAAVLKVPGQPRHIKAVVYHHASDRLGSAVLDLRKR